MLKRVMVSRFLQMKLHTSYITTGDDAVFEGLQNSIKQLSKLCRTTQIIQGGSISGKNIIDKV